MRFGNFVLLSFIGAQALDGVLTYVGVVTYGVQAEGNPLLAWYMGVFGPLPALVGAKLFAVVCGYTLHWQSLHRTIGLVTIVYLVMSAWPWMRVLWP